MDVCMVYFRWLVIAATLAVCAASVTAQDQPASDVERLFPNLAPSNDEEPKPADEGLFPPAIQIKPFGGQFFDRKESASTYEIVPVGKLDSIWRNRLRRLMSGDFVVRQASEEELQSLGVDALPALGAIACSQDAECRERAINVLNRMFLYGTPELTDAVDTLLTQLSDDPVRPVAREAQRLLHNHSQRRRNRAAVALVNLGAKVDMGPDLERIAMSYIVTDASLCANDHALVNTPDRVNLRQLITRDVSVAQTDVELRQELPQKPSGLFFTARYTGGAEGLRHVRRLGSLDDGSFDARSLEIYVTTDATVDVNAVQRVATYHPRSLVQVRGPSLGVQGSIFGRGCEITTVLEDSPAEKAGMQNNDIVREADGKIIRDFNDLVNAVGAKKSGQKIELVIDRWGVNGDGRNGFVPNMKLTATLEDRANIDTSSKLWCGEMVHIPEPPRLFPLPQFEPTGRARENRLPQPATNPFGFGRDDPAPSIPLPEK